MADERDPLDILRAKSWEELEAIEYEDRVLYPDALRLRTAKGDVREIKVMVQVLRKPERRRAFLEAVKIAQAAGVLPKEMPDFSNVRARAIDEQLFDDLDTLCIMARAIRDVEPPHVQHKTPEMLEAEYDMRSIEELWSRYKVYEDRSDPRLEITDEKRMWKATHAIAKAGNILPLTGAESLSQNACIVFMARQAVTSPRFKSFLASSDHSTPAS